MKHQPTLPSGDNLRIAKLYIVILTGYFLTGCSDEFSPRDQAYQRWVEQCPDHYAEGLNLTLDNVDDHVSPTRERAKAGDSEALRCVILNLEESLVPYTEKEIQQQVRWIGEPFSNSTQSTRIDLFRARYILYQQTGEGREELVELASQMSKDEIDANLYFYMFDPGIQPGRINDSCGRLAQQDPKYWLIELGTGEHSPEDCPVD